MTGPSDTETPRRRGGTDRRSAARLGAVQALYQAEFTETDAESVILETLTHRQGATLDNEEGIAFDRDLFGDLVRGTLRRQDEIDALLQRSLASGWRISRLEMVARAILRCAAYELGVRHDIPPKVTINEYVNVAHAFFAGEEPGFVNGVLDRLAHLLRADEFAGDDHEEPAEAG